MALDMRNSLSRNRPLPLLQFLRKLWGPVPWALEVTLVINLVARRPVDAVAVVLLLFTSAAAGYLQDVRAWKALSTLQRTVLPGATDGLPGSTLAPGSLQMLVRSIEKGLAISGTAMGLAVLGAALLRRLSPLDILPFSLLLIAASVPVLLQGILHRILAEGAAEMAGNGVRVSRLSAIEDTAGLQVLCLEKTGLLTESHISVAVVLPYQPYTAEDVLRLAAMVADGPAQNPIDAAVLEKARSTGAVPGFPQPIPYTAFRRLSKRSEAVYESDGETLRVMMGLPNVLFDLSGDSALERETNRLSGLGYRVQAVAVGDDAHMQVAGLLAFEDPLRADAQALVGRLREMGVHVVLMTGDGVKTAQAIAQQMGFDTAVFPLHALLPPVPSPIDGCIVEETATVAEMHPEDKARLVRVYRQSGCIVGLTASSPADIPALRQAQVGIAPASAPEAVRSAASLVLTGSGLAGIITALTSSRRVHRQMLVSSLYTVVIAALAAWFLGLATLLEGNPAITPLELVFLLLVVDLTACALPAARIAASRRPNPSGQRAQAGRFRSARLRSLIEVSLPLAGAMILLPCVILWAGENLLRLPLPALQTLLFTGLVFSSQGLLYLVSARRHAWKPFPGRGVLITTLAVPVAVSLMATRGILVAPIPLPIFLGLLVITLAYLAAIKFFMMDRAAAPRDPS